MARPTVPTVKFVELFEKYGAAETARRTDTTVRAVHGRRMRIEKEIGRPLYNPLGPGGGGGVLQERGPPKGAEIRLDIPDCVVIVGSDAHYWPGMISTAHAGMVKFIQDMRPAVVVQNGDVVDGATLSRHPSIGWEYKPQFFEEMEAAQARMGEIEEAAPGAHFIWPAGNHDLRYESKIANVAPELAKIRGVHLKDHFPKWTPCWRFRLNDVIVKHRHKGGLHAALNNTLWSGLSIVTGHLHKGIVYPLTDYNGTRYGVDAPTLAEPQGRQFVDYTEANATNWRSGFTVLTFIDGTLCMPELALVHDVGILEFRGKRIKV
jgi:hypothetical protein